MVSVSQYGFTKLIILQIKGYFNSFHGVVSNFTLHDKVAMSLNNTGMTPSSLSVQHIEQG